METRENYNDLILEAKKYGMVNNVLKNITIVKLIISSGLDRHLLCAFFELINRDLRENKLDEESLEFLRSGKLMDLIVNLEETVQQTNPRNLFPNERLDKINYYSLIEDNQTLATGYTHPEIISALCQEGVVSNAKDLTYWMEMGTYFSLPQNVQAVILNVLLEQGNIVKVQELLNLQASGLKKHSANFPGFKK